ncbi:SdpI family protein [Sporosalibacterium faouarense]|uniref:SdpI family protein n=1 Tax=Sporosalibacterium faouarense TaxID=516123 RepID=UPI00141CAEDC|nr:SdpI family protein [Sporosalibacterium faouarense]MTI47057.1 DUF1648 domain-containing protein [Bacillota bacterium]
MKIKISKTLLVLTIVSFIATLFVYGSLPEEIPIHWGINGEADNYAGKPFALLIGALPFILLILMLVLPKIDPRRESYEQHKKAYQITTILIVVIMIIFHWIAILKALEYNINISLIIKLVIGVMFIILGNYMTQIRHNYFFGIKTPWTLASENVWRKTHRVGGYGFMINGFLFLVTIPFKNILAMVPAIFTVVFIIGIYAYSYILFKKEKK